MSSFRTWAVAIGCMMSLFIIDGVCADDLDLDVQAPVSQVAWSGDWLVRGDVVRSSTYGDHVTRLWTRARYGPTWQIDDQWTLGGALRVDESTVGNDEVIDNNDNERSRDLALDSLFLSYAPTQNDRLLFGKTAFPLVLSRMLWDPDLRPAGISYMHEMRFDDDDAFRITGGGFRGEQMFGDQSRIVALQLGLTLHQTSLVSPEFVLTGLRFSDLDALAAAGLDRDNDTYNGHFADRFELVDAQFILHINTALPMRLLVDVDRNVKAGDRNKAARFEFAVGNSFRAHGQEAGIAVERMQRESVLGAFNDDDWWFHTNMHGTMLWWAYGLSDQVRFRAAFFHEQPDWDSYSYATRRLLLDLQWQL